MSSTTDSNPEAYQWEALSLTNQYRASQGKAALCLEPRLNRAARNHTIDMSVNSFLSPMGNDGSSALVRIQAAGYEPTHWGINTLYGENQVNATHAAAQWTSSSVSSQAALILGSQFTHSGVYRSLGFCPDSPSTICTFWTQIYATGFSGAQCITAPANLIESLAQPVAVTHDGTTTGSTITETATGPSGPRHFSPAVILGITIGSVGAMLLSVTIMVLFLHGRQKRERNQSFQVVRAERMSEASVKTGRVGVGAWRSSGPGPSKLTGSPSIPLTRVAATVEKESVHKDARVVDFSRP